MSLPVRSLQPPVIILGLLALLPIHSLSLPDSVPSPRGTGFQQGSATGGHCHEAGRPQEKPGCVSSTSLSQVAS